MCLTLAGWSGRPLNVGADGLKRWRCQGGPRVHRSRADLHGQSGPGQSGARQYRHHLGGCRPYHQGHCYGEQRHRWHPCSRLTDEH